MFEEKYKAALLELKQNKSKLSGALKKLNDSEKGSKDFESILSSQKLVTDKSGLGFNQVSN